MGFLDFLKKKEGSKGDSEESNEKDSKAEKKDSVTPQGKYSEVCSLCGKAGTEIKWAGQFWHKKCMRAGKKMAKKMM